MKTGLESTLSVLLPFLQKPEEIHFASEIETEMSLPSVYRILQTLEDMTIVNKAKTTYTLNPRALHDAKFFREVLPYVGRQTPQKTMLYTIRYFLYDFTMRHTVKELSMLFQRKRVQITAMLELLKTNKIIQSESQQLTKKRKTVFYSLNKDMAKTLGKANVITMHKSKIEVYNVCKL
jgi:hypothetical protein